METRFESYLKTQKLYGKENKEHELFYQFWKSSQSKVKGLILVTHGLSEHSDCYKSFAEALNEWGWNVIVWDLPGHGRSSGKRGYIGQFDDFLKDQKYFLDWVLKKWSLPDTPLILFSHSLGALITLKGLLVYGQARVQALCLSAPCLGLSLKPSWFKVFFAKVAAYFFPCLTLCNEIKYRELTHDETMIKSYASDAYRHGQISSKLFLGLVRSCAFVKKRVSDFSLPTLIQWGEKDSIIDVETVKKFYKDLKCNLKRCHNYKNSLHEIYNDLERKDVYEDLKIFLEEVFAHFEKENKNEEI